MNAGIVASRYARALLKFVQETGNGDKVYSQACVLVLRMEEIGQLKAYVCDQNNIGTDKRIALLEAALGEPMSMEIRRFVSLVHEKGRTSSIFRMFHAFISMYRQENGIKGGRLITALPAEGLKEKMEKAFSEKTGADVRLEMKVNPDIIGGFIFELEDIRLDASVESQFRKIRRQLIEKNNRIV